MSSDISYGQLVVISGVNVNNDIISASQKAIAFATSNGMLAEEPITGLSAETFNFNKDVNIGDDLVVGGKITVNSLVDKNKVIVADSTKSLKSSTITTTELDYLSGTSSNIQDQINSKVSMDGPIFTGITNFSTSTFSGTATFTRPVNINNTFYVSEDSRIAANLFLDENFTVNTDKFFVNATSGNVGILTADPSCVLDISATDAIRIPVGTTGERPSVVQTGLIRFNTTTSQFEGYNNNSSWQGLGGVVDIDQDTRITAESNPLDDNDELQFFTKNVQRMQIDASGNIQMNLDDSSYVALDVSATTGIMLPKGGSAQRPIAGGRDTSIRSDISGAIRFNTDTNLCEMYTASAIWSGLPLYKTEQPPKLLNISTNPLNESVSVSWTKFQEIYRDSDTGKSYPTYLQTFVDISFTSINGQSSNGWKTVLIGNGNYNINDVETSPLTSINFDSVVTTVSSNTTGYSLTFVDKPSTSNLPVFTQDDSFDLRVYGVNNSGTLPNYIYMYGVALKQTVAPGPVTVANTYSINKTSFSMNLEFDLDASDATITDGISIVHYDISYDLYETKSLVDTRTDNNYQWKNWSEPTSLSKNGIVVFGLLPGARYSVEVRAKNALKFNSPGNEDGHPSTQEYKYGVYGPLAITSDYTRLSTTRYIDSSDLNHVYPTNMNCTLNGFGNIDCYINGDAGSRTTRKVLSYLNSDSKIVLSGTSNFYVNYGKQGKDMNELTETTPLVRLTINIKNKNGYINDTINFTRKNLYEQTGAITTSMDSSYAFVSSSTYTDRGLNNSVNGFVYSADISCIAGDSNNTIFKSDFPPSIQDYSLSYSIVSLGLNDNQQIQKNSTSSSASLSTTTFYVDDYNSYPKVTFIQAVDEPTISVTGESYLFGIPSCTQVTLIATFTVGHFANYLIPYNHSNVKAITDKYSYSFLEHNKLAVYSDASYVINYNKIANVGYGTYDENTSSNFVIGVNHLNNISIPTVNEYLDNDKYVGNIGHIFREIQDTFSYAMHFFNGTSIETYTIAKNHASFVSAHGANYVKNTLIRFNGKFVSGGFSESYSGTTITAFDDWSTLGGGYVLNGFDYSNFASDGIDEYKWIALDITEKKSGNNIDLSNFKIRGQLPDINKFGIAGNINGYRAYISYNGKFGSLKSVFNALETLWFKDSNNSTINLADNINGALQNDGIDAFVDITTTQTIYLLVGLPKSLNTWFTFE